MTLSWADTFWKLSCGSSCKANKEWLYLITSACKNYITAELSLCSLNYNLTSGTRKLPPTQFIACRAINSFFDWPDMDLLCLIIASLLHWPLFRFKMIFLIIFLCLYVHCKEILNVHRKYTQILWSEFHLHALQVDIYQLISLISLKCIILLTLT